MKGLDDDVFQPLIIGDDSDESLEAEEGYVKEFRPFPYAEHKDSGKIVLLIVD